MGREMAVTVGAAIMDSVGGAIASDACRSAFGFAPSVRSLLLLAGAAGVTLVGVIVLTLVGATASFARRCERS